MPLEVSEIQGFLALAVAVLGPIAERSKNTWDDKAILILAYVQKHPDLITLIQKLIDGDVTEAQLQALVGAAS